MGSEPIERDRAETRSRRAASQAVPIYEYDAAESRFSFAFNDIAEAFKRWRLLTTLVRTTFYNRYQGTLFGGFWLTLSTLMFVVGTGLVWGTVFGVSLQEYFPHISSGIILWGIISTLINDASSIFILGGAAFNQSPMPRSIFPLRSIGLVLINLAYKLIVLAGVFVYFDVPVTVQGVVLSLLGLALTLYTGFWLALTIGPITLRFRDLGQVVASVMTVAFFFTPVIWQRERLGEYAYLLNFNPLYHFLHIMRAPLLGEPGVAGSFLGAAIIAALTTAAGVTVYGLFARRLNYWV